MAVVIYTLTVEQDHIVNVGDAIFNAPLAGSSGSQHTLTDGDSLMNSGGIAALNATFLTGHPSAKDTTVSGLDIQGIDTWSIRNLGNEGTVLLTGLNESSQFIDLATLDYDGTGHQASLVIGDDAKPIVGKAHDFQITLLDALGNGANGLATIFAADAFTSSDSVDVVARNAGGLPAGAAAPPAMAGGGPNWGGFAGLAYAVVAAGSKGADGFATWQLASAGATGKAVDFANFTTFSGLNLVALGAAGVASATKISLQDDGSSTMLWASLFDGSTAHDWSKVTTIDLSGTRGFVIVTGAEAGDAGLLADTATALRDLTIKGGTGNSFYDLSGLGDAAGAPAVAGTVIQGGSGKGNNEVAIADSVAFGQDTIQLANIQVLDVAGNAHGSGAGGASTMDMSSFPGLVPVTSGTVYRLISESNSPTNDVSSPFAVLQFVNHEGGVAAAQAGDLLIKNGLPSFAVNMQGMANGGDDHQANSGSNITIQRGFPINATDSLKLWLSYDGISHLPTGLASALDVPTFSVTDYAITDVYLRYDSSGSGARHAVFLGSTFVNDFPATTAPSSLNFFDNTDTYAPNSPATDLYLGRVDGLQSVAFPVGDPTEAIGHDSVLVRGAPGTSTITDSGRGMFFIGAADASDLSAASTAGLVMDVAGTATGTSQHVAGIRAVGSTTYQNLLQGTSGQIELDSHGHDPSTKVYTPLVQIGPQSNGLSGVGSDTLTGGTGLSQQGTAVKGGDNFFGAGGPDAITLESHGKGYQTSTIWIGVYDVGHGPHSSQLASASIGATYGQAITDIVFDAKSNQFVESYVNGYGGYSPTGSTPWVTTVANFALGDAGDHLGLYAPDWATGPLGAKFPLPGAQARGLVDGSGEQVAAGATTIVDAISKAGDTVAGNANVIVDLIGKYASAADLADGLMHAAGQMKFAQTAFSSGSTEHLIVAYATPGGSANIADVVLKNVSTATLTAFGTADTTIAVTASDMASLSGIDSLASFSPANIQFAALSVPSSSAPYTELPNSTFLDFGSYRSGAVALTGGSPVSSFTLNVALVLDRANDPSGLLGADWASRQDQLAALNASGKLWSTYGAERAKYDAVITDLAALGIKTVDADSPVNGYVSSPESRTIWVQVDQDTFTTLFGPTATLLEGKDQSGNLVRYWDGNLSLPTGLATTLGVSGLWFDSSFASVLPNPGNGVQAPMAQGWQSPGNAAGSAQSDLFAYQIADTYYDFPFAGPLWNPSSGSAVATGAIGLVEPGVGTSLPGDNRGAGFQSAIDTFRHTAGIGTSAVVTDIAPGGQKYPNAQPPAFDPAGERSLDVGVVTAANPQSPLILYAGSGYAAGAEANAFTAYQSAFWDTTNNPAVVSSSFAYQAESAPASPFYAAARELFVDAALRNISIFNSNGDGGSGDKYGNGLTNVSSGRASPYAVMVGGTSLSTVDSALADKTLASLTTAALAGDPATLWQLIAGGLTTMPDPSSGTASLIESVWNRYYLDGTKIGVPGAKNQTGFLHNNTGSGGVDSTQPVPSYQSEFGLTPTTSDPSALVGRGTPDVAADAGGNMLYIVPTADMTGTSNDDGTSAAAPLWASLASQINAVFGDQGLHQLGYFNDLLYTAAVIAPASFNDITLGSNTSSFTLGGPITSDDTAITPTGFGYSAGPGYDLTTGLGTPDGLLLARALTAIAHQQVSFDSVPGLLTSTGAGGWTAAVAETLLIQTTSTAAATIGLLVGSGSITVTSPATESFASTSRLAQQSLQPDFDPDLVRLFDGQTQGALVQATPLAGNQVAVLIDGLASQTPQATLSNPFGFVDFTSSTGGAAVHIARAVAVAETAGGADDQHAVVRIRQNGEDKLQLELYRVDDFNGTIGGLQPGAPGYAAAADARAYATTSGGTTIAGPGYGNFLQTELKGVDAGDLIAMTLSNGSQRFWAFAQANESVAGAPVGHLWNYGLNVWGWEDIAGGGDRDYNDLIVGLDFTSASGHGWLV
ncbi:MAG: hypothetical protein U1E60_15285 [Reyranellaceae bacterium]